MAEDKIIAAFLDLLAEQPYAKLNVRTIMSHAELTRTVFYEYFDNKDDLARVTLSTLLEGVILRASKVFTPNRTMNTATTLASLQVLRDHRHEIRLLFAVQQGEVHLRAEFQQQVANLIRAQVQQYWPQTPARKVDYFAQLFASSMITTILWFFQHEDATEAEVVAAIDTCVFQGMSGLLTQS
ncbi:TetR/AcrR family transcriptional regulator [Levilactobacillus fujinensis]|uniref:TetR/AcrR family transcriptional regulator n=1 Tax=Levilactobacillus fujinensis TaxID=2486024 RepID=A0ABW1TGT3_9LACO|nr:TetR/AcrR family transcriptional regulator [Levilactobacillus fujinensis]